MYLKTGLQARPPAAYLPDLITRVINSCPPGAVEATIHAALTGRENIAAQKRMRDIVFTEIIALQGSAAFAPDTPQWRALVHLVLHFAHKCGFTHLPAPSVVEVRDTPLAGLDEVLDRMISSDIPYATRDEIGGEAATWGSFTSTLVAQWNVILLRDERRSKWGRQLIQYAQHIGWKLLEKGSGALDAWERSFFLAVASADPRLKSTAAFGPANGGMPDTLLPVARTIDDDVFDTWERYKAVVEPGPYTRFVALDYEKRDDVTVFHLGVPPRTLTVLSGQIISHGPFTEFYVKPLLDIPWSAKSQLDAVVEALPYSHRSRDKELFVEQPPIQGADGDGIHPFATLDHPEFELYFQVMHETARSPGGQAYAPYLHQIDVRFRSKHWKRNFDSGSGLFPGPIIFIYDTILTNGSWSADATKEPLLSEFPYLDLSVSPGIVDRVRADGESRPAREKGLVLARDVIGKNVAWFFPEAGEDVVSFFSYPVNHSFTKQGRVQVLPPLRHLVRVPRAWLFDENTFGEQVNYVMGRLGFLEQEASSLRPSLAVSANVSIWHDLLPDANVPLHLPAQFANVYSVLG